MIREFKLPDLGEGLTESEIVEWHVDVGDTVTLNQSIVEVETAKAAVQIPSPFAGVVTALLAEPGATVRVGVPILAIEVQVDAAAGAPAGASAQPAAVAETTAAVAEPPELAAENAEPAVRVERTPVLVGYGPAVATGQRPQRRPHSWPEPEHPVFVPARGAALATPPVRKYAHDLGVDLAHVRGTGDEGAITRDDVQLAASRPVGPHDDDIRVPIRGVRKATAAAMVLSAFTAPHVTEFLTVDVTRALAAVRTVKQRGGDASLLGLVARALCLALDRTPEANSHWDEVAGEIVQYSHVNLGIAVATPKGLMVPHVRDAASLSLGEITRAIGALAERAREGVVTPAELTGGTVTITNVGVFGVDAGTPILNPGEAAILALGAVRRTPWEFEGEIALRDVMTLALSFDHRLVDGQQGSRVLTDVGGMLCDPGYHLTW